MNTLKKTLKTPRSLGLFFSQETVESRCLPESIPRIAGCQSQCAKGSGGAAAGGREYGADCGLYLNILCCTCNNTMYILLYAIYI